jgi:itaconate CoA-transferase
MMQPHYLGTYGGTPFRRSGAQHASIAPYGPHRVADGTIFIGVQNNREWRALCEHVLGRPELVEHPDFRDNTSRVRARDTLTDILETAWRTRSADDLLLELERRGIASARVRSAEDLSAHPQLLARDRWGQVSTALGSVRALVPPLEFAGQKPVMGAVPTLGQHTEAIRAEFSAPPAAASERHGRGKS